jgi:coatomer subunit delta
MRLKNPNRSSLSAIHDHNDMLLTTPSRAPALRGKGMQLGKKSKTSDLFERVRGDMSPQTTGNESVLSKNHPISPAELAHSTPVPASLGQDGIRITIAESISAKISREGVLKFLNVKGDLQLYISDASLTKVKLELIANPTHNALFRTHPNVDKELFTKSKTIRLRDNSKGFPPSNAVGVLRWSASATAETQDVLPINFTVWVNKGTEDSWTLTVEYELTGRDTLRDVAVTIPYATSEPAVSSFDANYEVSGDCLKWVIGTIDELSATGNFDFEAQAEDETEFFPMSVQFTKDNPLIDLDVRFILMEPLKWTNTYFRYRLSSCWRVVKKCPLSRRLSQLLIRILLSDPMIYRKLVKALSEVMHKKSNTIRPGFKRHPSKRLQGGLK